MSDAVELTERERLTIVLGALVTLMLAALDQTIVAPALPTIGAHLGDVDYLSWVVSAYFLTSTAVTPLYGKLADLKGRRPTLYAAIAIFTLGSLACALAPTMKLLVLARAVQGLGGGGLISLVQTVIGDVVPPSRRGKYMVWITLVWGTASVAGPVLGGVFAEHLHWSMIFWINLPIALAAVVMIRRSLARLPDVRRPHRLDLVGSALIVGASVALMLALTWGGASLPWGSPTVIGLFAASAVLFVGFGWHIAHTEEALIPLPILRNPVIAVVSSALFFAMGGYVGLAVYAPIWFESVHGLGPADAGLGLLALTLGTVAGANAAGRAMSRIVHYRRFALVGTAIAVVSLVGLSLGAATLPFWAGEILLATAGMGTGTLFPIGTVAVQNAVERHDLGVATSTLAFLRSLGSVVAVAVLGAVLLASGLGGTLVASGAPDPAAVAVAGAAFTRLFGVAAFGLGCTFVLMLFLEERPLADHPAAKPSQPAR